jgi:hypothetical protein
VPFLLPSFLWASKEKKVGCRDDIPTHPLEVGRTTHAKRHQWIPASAGMTQR